MARYIQITLWILLALLCLAHGAGAATLRFRQGVDGYIGTQDTDLNANEPDRIQGSDNSCLADLDSPVAQALIRFDNIFGEGPGQVPPQSIIVSATLVLRTSNIGDLCRGFRVLVPWDESTSTWNSHADGISADGLEMNPDVLFELDSTLPGEVFNLDVTSTIAGWLAGTFPNFGWGITNIGPDGWQFHSSEAFAITNRPMLEIVFDPPPQSPRIIAQPVSVTNHAEGEPVTFSVAITGFDPLYQWFKDGFPLEDATNASHTIQTVLLVDEGIYTVSVSNAYGGELSQPANLSVIHDNTRPFVACAFGANDPLRVFVRFSEPVTNAADLAHYMVMSAGGSDLLAVASAVYSDSGIQRSEIVLQLDPASPLQANLAYTLRTSNIFDRIGNPVDPSHSVRISIDFAPVFTIGESQIWKYDDSGADLGPTWKDLSFDDSAWKSGPALLGFEPSVLAEPLRTPLNRTNAAGAVIRTHYLRTRFMHDSGLNGLLRFSTMLDDAAAIYLNGAEIFRLRLPPGPLNYLTEGFVVVSNAAYEGPFTVCVTNLVSGENLLAVEVHQTGFNSSDMVWGLELHREANVGRLNARISALDGRLVLSWTGPALLQANENFSNTNGWVTIEGATSGFRAPMSGKNFFRLRD